MAIVGGETTTNPERIFISVALLGWVPRGKGVLRSGAEAGDAIFVTGELGGSLAGKHLDFEPRLAEARWLAEHFPLHAMLDMSDGLAGDLRHILKASRVGADCSPRPSPSAARRAGAPRPSHAAKPPLAGGADRRRGLRTAVHRRQPRRRAAAGRLEKEFPKLRLTCIGKIKAGEGITIRDKHGVRPLTAHGYVHFA